MIAAREHLVALLAIIDEERAAAMLDAQQTTRARALLEDLVRRAPRRSRRWSLLALACYRLGLILEGTHARAFAGMAPKEIGDQLHAHTVSLLEQALTLI